MTRILSVMIQDFPPTGMIYGAERSYIDLLENLVLLGAEAQFIELSPSLVRLSGSSLPYTEVERGSFYLIRAIIEAIRSAIHFRSDVVFAYHSDHLSSVIPAFFASLVAGKPFFLGVLDDRNEPTDRLSYHASFSRILVEERSLAKSIWKLALIFMRRVACKRAICFTPTKHVAKYAISCLHSKHVFVIGRGVSSIWFEALEEQGSVRTFDACYVGRIDPMKGISTLFKAWKQVAEKIPGAKLLLIGEAWPGLLQGFLNELKELCISENVILVGYLSDISSMKKLLSSSKIFVFPSKMEGFARAVVEAMACGLPCVLGDIPSMREIFGEVALFVPPDDYSQLARTITYLLEDNEKRKAMSDGSRRLAKRHLWPAVASRTLGIINSTIKSRESKAS